jgi:hypothetical protein
MRIPIIQNGEARTARDSNNKLVKRGDKVQVHVAAMDRTKLEHGRPKVIKKIAVGRVYGIDSDNTIKVADFEDQDVIDEHIETGQFTKVGG